MKRKLLFHFFAFLSAALCFAQGNKIPRGIDLCNAISSLCRDNNAEPEILNLVANANSGFPYNISVSFPAELGNESDDDNLRSNLAFIIKQEDAYKKNAILTNLLVNLSAEKRDFDINIILVFGDNQIVSKDNSIFGSAAFLNSIDNQAKYSCILISIDEEKSKILPGCGGMLSPSWFVKNVYSSFIKNNLLLGYNKNYISSIYKINLFEDSMQKLYLAAGIPCIKTCFAKSVPDDVVSGTLMNIADYYNCRETNKSSHHSIMYTLFSKQIWMSEESIIRAILISVFTVLLILISYGFVNESFKFISWSKIKKIWHFPFLFYFLSLFVFFIAEQLISFLRNKLSVPVSLFTSISFILPLIFITISMTFLFALRYSPEFKKKTIDLLVFFVGAFNLCVFCLIDISLFPIFAFVFLLTLLSAVFKNNFIHFVILILAELPFLPFILQILNNADYYLISNFLRKEKIFSLLLILIILPQFLLCFRLFTGFNFYWAKQGVSAPKRSAYNIISLTVFISVFMFFIALLTPSNFKVTNPKSENKIIISKSETPSVKIATEKRLVFKDIIRTIKIEAEKPVLQCDLKIRGEKGMPVLFSDNDFIAENSKEASFLIPYEPPSKMEFSYGEAGMNNGLVLTVIYSDFSMDKIEIEKLN